MNKVFVLFFVLCSLLSSCGSTNNEEVILIAASANVQYPINDIVKGFEEKTGINCEIIVSSSGKLSAQIKEGAPYDVFISADMVYPGDLYDKGFCATPPKSYASGTLILWTALPNQKVSMEYLLSEKVNHIAIPNPMLAPYGKAVMEALEFYGIDEKIRSKIVYGESISQTNQFITTKVAEVGFTAKSVVLLPEMAEIGHWEEVDRQAYTIINQGAVVVSTNEKKLNYAHAFYEYLFSKESEDILTNYGYGLIERSNDE